jgi:hypothetical protein
MFSGASDADRSKQFQQVCFNSLLQHLGLVKTQGMEKNWMYDLGFKK